MASQNQPVGLLYQEEGTASTDEKDFGKTRQEDRRPLPQLIRNSVEGVSTSRQLVKNAEKFQHGRIIIQMIILFFCHQSK